MLRKPIGAWLFLKQRRQGSDPTVVCCWAPMKEFSHRGRWRWGVAVASRRISGVDIMELPKHKLLAVIVLVH